MSSSFDMQPNAELNKQLYDGTFYHHSQCWVIVALVSRGYQFFSLYRVKSHATPNRGISRNMRHEFNHRSGGFKIGSLPTASEDASIIVTVHHRDTEYTENH